MVNTIKNLVFEGGGVLGISYLGVLDCLWEKNMMHNIEKMAGTSAGAITACITSFNLPFSEIKNIVESLDYKQVPQKEDESNQRISVFMRSEIERVFGDVDCLYRLVNNYGWYSTQYFYKWIQKQIASQFDSTKKQPPYTFKDFKDNSIHKDKRKFLELYIVGTDISCKVSKVFSFSTTPDMEVAEAVRISMSVPLFFEANKVKSYEVNRDSLTHIFSDGGVMRNYPINIFDLEGANQETLGARFKYDIEFTEINNIIEYISNFYMALAKVQQDIYRNSPKDIERSIQIDTKDISVLDFNISTNDSTYKFLYKQGYEAAKAYFKYRDRLRN
ncbi:patatin-like phospholipase family protein [Clostridium sp. YIM B02515]|uniref:Patatin-like phospholipase family protein n=1 Tax=Clostridium rhizosphaerae TaxID=2803861 RepID=A0ABS1TFY1_9CLOT|nr:patatin-like phospholipase family protein [Clostridium rhizosphaerae]MBL4938280.1 patatin-like phospholipase family protein [Clostridium rhizosphaerae]